MEDMISTLTNLIDENLKSIVAAIIALLGPWLFSFFRRPKSVSQGEAKYFAADQLLTPPIERPAYSDRMAYVLAEMSSLAYAPFEGSGEKLELASKELIDKKLNVPEEAKAWLEKFADELLISGVDSRGFLEKILSAADFELLDIIDIEGTQAFICKHTGDADPYLVLAYRGTEKRIHDWLTDADAKPNDQGVHTGFWNALKVKEKNGVNALQTVEKILTNAGWEASDKEAPPLFITGHSLGGALALLTTKELTSGINGACYTYGAPRIANYEYFKGIKTPVFRVVNSADIVPRVPPGATLGLLVKLVQGLKWATGWFPMLSSLFEWIEPKVDQLNGYRHFGDMRYLTDVKNGRFNDVRLLSNPPAIDRLLWMGEHIRNSFSFTFKSHGMELYRKKLRHVAGVRNLKGTGQTPESPTIDEQQPDTRDEYDSPRNADNGGVETSDTPAG